MNTGRLFYEDEYDALQTMVASSGKTVKELAAALWPDMKHESRYAKFKDCLDRKGSEQFKFSQVVLLMKMCERYDPLMYQCDETLHARPDRKTVDDESLKLVETINSAANTLSKAMAQLERLRANT